MCVVAAVAVAQREQLHSAPHTSFVSGLSWLANVLPPSSKPSKPKPKPETKASGDLKVGPGQSLLPLHGNGERLRSVGQGWLSDTNYGPTGVQ